MLWKRSIKSDSVNRREPVEMIGMDDFVFHKPA